MQKEIKNFLEFKGYRLLDAPDAQFQNYLKRIDNKNEVIQVIKLDGKYTYNIDRIKSLHNRVLNAFSKGETEVLTIIYGKIEYDIKVLQANIDHLWICDTENGTLYIGNTTDKWGYAKFFSDQALKQSIKNRPKEAITNSSYYITEEERKEVSHGYYVLIFFVAINVIIFSLMSFMGDMNDRNWLIKCGALYNIVVESGQDHWRFITCMFIHFNLPHLLNNMFVLITVGHYVEKGMGHIKFALTYLISGLGGSLASYYRMIHEEMNEVSAGASGAIYGCVGALLALIIMNHGRYENIGWKQMLFMIMMMVYYSVTTAGVDNEAHLGGLVVGFFVAILFLAFRKKNKYT